MKRMIYLAILAPMMIIGCSKKSDDSAKKNTDEVIKVKTEVAKSQEIDRIYEFSSTVDAEVKNYISSAGGTRIEKIMVEVGDKVRKGQQLVKMESTNLITTMAQLENLKTELDRMKALYASGGVSKQQLDQLQLQYDVAKKSADNLKDNIYLTSPIDGVVTMRNFDNGDVAASQPILQVMKINPVKIKINISESFYTKVKVGMEVKLKTEIFEEEEFTGKISLIYPTIDPVSRTFTCEIKVNNANNKLKPGMFGRVELNLGKANTILIADKAVVKQSGSNDRFVYVEKEGVVEYRKVEIGRRLGNQFEIIKGITEGENIVITGQSKLLDGTKVNVIK
jgi:RND family efflux transporter MFP subunit